MKQVGTRDAQVNLTKLLTDLPFEITRFGKVVARVIKPIKEDKFVPPEEPTVNPDPIKKIIEERRKQELDNWGSNKLFCQICHRTPAISKPYNYDDGTGGNIGYFCKKHSDELDNKDDRKTVDVDTYIPRKQADFTNFTPLPKPIKKEKKK